MGKDSLKETLKFPYEIDKALLILMKGRKNTSANHVMYDGVKAAINKTIMEDMLAIIGEDEEVNSTKMAGIRKPVLNTDDDIYAHGRNRLRAELRQAVKERYGGSNE